MKTTPRLPLHGKRFCCTEKTSNWQQFLTALGAELVSFSSLSNDVFLLADHQQEGHPREKQLTTLWLRYQYARSEAWQPASSSPLFRPLRGAHIPGMTSLTITFSGVSRAGMEHACALVAASGAAYSPGLHLGKSTHLVCTSEEGRKRRMILAQAAAGDGNAAAAAQLHVVSMCWLVECVRQWRRVDEKPHLLNSAGSGGRLEAGEESSEESASSSAEEVSVPRTADHAPRLFLGRHVSPYMPSMCCPRHGPLLQLLHRSNLSLDTIIMNYS